MITKEGEIIEELFRIITELDARECSSNCVIQEYQGTGWRELCDNAIKLIEDLKEIGI